jgi:hypothetical protein
MPEQIEVEPLGEHEYLVRARHGGGDLESRFRASRNVLDRAGVRAGDEQRAIEHSVAFLLEHQPVIDLPPMVDLDDMAAAFDDYLGFLRERLAGA